MHLAPRVFSLVCLITLSLAPAAVRAQDASAMVRLLKSGRLPPERIGAVLKLACERGNEQDLAYIYEQATKPDGFSADLRRQAIEGLATAAQTRKVRPHVPAEGLLALLDDRDPATARAAVRLGGGLATADAGTAIGRTRARRQNRRRVAAHGARGIRGHRR